MKWSIPFCDAPFLTASDELRGLYPVAFTREQLMDWYVNANLAHFSITGVPDILDAQLEITEAMSTLNTGQLAALDIAVFPILQSAEGRTHVLGDMRRRWERDKCNALRLVFNFNMCYVEINFTDVKRKPVGLTNMLYYPRMVVIFYASGYVWTNDLTLLFGAGHAIGAIDVVGSSGAIIDVYAVSGSGPPVGSPSLFGEIEISERVDAMTFAPKTAPVGANVTLSGIDFGAITKVMVGDTAAQSFVLADDNKSVTFPVPAGSRPDYIFAETLAGGLYGTTQPLIVT